MLDETLLARFRQLGLDAAEAGGVVTGQKEAIRVRWLLGGRKTEYRASCRLDEARQTVHFREAVIDRAWGLPPPELRVEKYGLKGGRLSGELKVVSLAGGGVLNFGEVREAVEHEAAAAGWQFDLEIGRQPERVK